MSQHTPGPWKVDGSGMGIYTETPMNAAGFCPVVGSSAAVDLSLAQCRANANLIAAAPDLLDAATAVAAILRGWPMPGMKAEFDALLAAIDKANGRKEAATAAIPAECEF